MKKLFITFIIIALTITHMMAQTVEVTLNEEAVSGNWADPIWNITYTINPTGSEDHDNFKDLINAHPSTANGLIDIYFNNNVQLEMQSLAKSDRTDIKYKSITFKYKDGTEQTRTINGDNAISITNISNETDVQQIFNVPVNFVAAGSEDPALTGYGPIIFQKAITGSNVSITLNKATEDYLPDENHYIFNDRVEFTNGTININAETTFNSNLTCSELNIAKSANQVTFKGDVTVNGDAIDNGVSNYEKTLTITENLTTNDTTAIQMHTTVGKNCYINAPLYILDTLKVSGDILITSNSPIVIMQSLNGTRKGWLQMTEENHEIPLLHIYNGGMATIANGTIKTLDFKGAWNAGTANATTNVKLTNETVENLSMLRTANESRKLPINGTGLTINNTTIEMDFPNPSRYYCVGFPFDVTVSGSPTEIAEYDGVTRSNGGAGWKLASGNILKAGKGYAIMSSTPVTFTATNTGAKFTQTTGTLPITYYKGTSIYEENYGWNLVTVPFANPQPLNITEGMFVYRYVPESDSYITLQTGDTFTPNPFEAFFIKTAEGTETAEFGTSQAAMPSKIARVIQPRIQLNLLADGYEYSTRINYDENATTAYDALYDAPFSGGMMPDATWFYSFCAGQNGQYAINSVPEEIEEINLGFRLMNTNGGTSYTITWENTAGLDFELYDTEMQIATDMVSLNSYSFMVANDGINTERFVIRKKNASGPTTSIEEVSANKNILIQEGTIIINTENSAHISIYDIMGHVIAEGDNKGQQQYNIGQPGIYIVTINGEATKVLVK